MHVETSLLSPGDAAVIGPLQNRIWRSTYTGLLPDAVLADQDDAESQRTWHARALEHVEHGRSLAGCATWVAHDEAGTPVGWIGVGEPRDDDPPASVELWSLYVAPEHQGAGVARHLVEAIVPAGPCYLWVLQGNERAIAFYRKVGFETDGAVKPFADTGALELRMVRLA
jgi:ribosomal protein S18 acetylase RimI-like enzyme